MHQNNKAFQYGKAMHPISKNFLNKNKKVHHRNNRGGFLPIYTVLLQLNFGRMQI